MLHGDLWSGNAASINGEPVIFDAASFYGHHEYDLGIAKMFGGFGSGILIGLTFIVLCHFLPIAMQFILNFNGSLRGST